MSQTLYKKSEKYNYSDYILPHGTINGVAVPFYTTPEYRDELKTKFKLRPDDDIFIVTFPKSGTTLAQSILCEMLFLNDEDEFSKMKLNDRIPFTDDAILFPLDTINDWPSPRVFKCHHHSPEEMDDLIFKGNRTVKIIYVLRDPRDAAVSLYHHLKTTGLSEFVSNATFDEFITKYVQDKTVAFYGLWEDHVSNWLSRRDEFNMLVLKYEDMIKNSSKEIQKISSFIGMELPPERITEIADKTSFTSATKRKDLFEDETGVHSSLVL